MGHITSFICFSRNFFHTSYTFLKGGFHVCLKYFSTFTCLEKRKEFKRQWHQWDVKTPPYCRILYHHTNFLCTCSTPRGKNSVMVLSNSLIVYFKKGSILLALFYWLVNIFFILQGCQNRHVVFMFTSNTFTWLVKFVSCT